MTRNGAERALIAAYKYRQKRYSRNVHGSQPGRNAFNEQHMAEEITGLEQLVEELGGCPGECLRRSRGEPQQTASLEEIDRYMET